MEEVAQGNRSKDPTPETCGEEVEGVCSQRQEVGGFSAAAAAVAVATAAALPAEMAGSRNTEEAEGPEPL